MRRKKIRERYNTYIYKIYIFSHSALSPSTRVSAIQAYLHSFSNPMLDTTHGVVRFSRCFSPPPPSSLCAFPFTFSYIYI